ncbi:MAG: hypothetical protein CMLOHMNK_02975 [Steroidobacteraceae bacterium]|nr:hypothetical protein [Steroidobacteraceae bacterium]
MPHHGELGKVGGMRERDFRHAVPAAFALPFIEQLNRLGCDVESLWRDAHMSVPVKEVQRRRVPTLPTGEFARFYRLAIGALEGRCCAREGGRPLGKLAVDMMCYTLIHCATLEKAVERAALFNRAMEERGADAQLQRRGERVWFTIDTRRRVRDGAAMLVDLTGINLHYQLFSWLVGRRLPEVEAGLAYPPPSRPNPLYEAYGIPLRFDQQVNYLSFPANCLRLKLVRSHAELERVIGFLPFRLDVGNARSGNLVLSIRLLIADALQHQGRVPDAEAVAQLFYMSTASMRRHLRAEGSSYSGLRGACQREAAEHLLRHTDMPIAEVARRVGLGGGRAFRRSFRQWTRALPSEFRRRAAGR